MNDLDRRDFYRIDDLIHLIHTPIDPDHASGNPYDERYPIPREALLVSQLQTINNDNRDLLRLVGDSNRALGNYLRSIDEKIKLLAQYIASDDPELQQKVPVTLSEGGLSFYSGELLEIGTCLHLVIVLFPKINAIAAIGTVKTNEKLEEHPTLYRLGVEFTSLNEADRKQLVRHIRRLESQGIREQGQNSTNNN
ncbi:MAG: PilZ domain-containing protein [Ketobacter sp.]|uniref:PilZ domain-containing protein n=1 Tax=Ketobacter sp. MCCC 1A13808 TaxID=2602738 RepID=UPI0012EC11D4|nr:PilZ domain-containing protein [Ketobacter sp. MCCC 1A13808]